MKNQKEYSDKINKTANRDYWWAYIPFIFYFIYLLFQYVKNPLHWSFLNNVNLVFHEAGHIIFMFFGRFVEILGGSLFECLLPTALAALFIRSKNYFGTAFCLSWLGVALFDTAAYIGDAQKMALPLLADGLVHDWNYLLSELNLLSQTETISSFVRFFGGLSMLLGISLGIISTWEKYLLSKNKSLI